MKIFHSAGILLAVLFLSGAYAAASSVPGKTAAHGQAMAKAPQQASPEHAKLGPMHYYGGPKSVMWRAPAPE